MARVNNYLIQARQAKDLFLTFDQEKLIQKFQMEHDETFLYIPMLSQKHRIHRVTGDMERLTETGWVDANSHGEVMTLLDLVCDSRDSRFLTGRWKNMANFGLLFHQNLLEGQKDPWADLFEQNPEAFSKACRSLGGRELPMGDLCYAIELFDGLEIALQLWFGDEEFPASLRFLWDENALMYIKYETMYFARGMLLERIRERMQ